MEMEKVNKKATFKEYCEEITTKEFLEESKETLRIADKIENYLKNMGLFWALTVVNMNSLNLKLNTKKRNHILAIVASGGGKSAFLDNMLDIESKTKLPSKMFESELIKMDKEYFNRKVMVHDDLIQAFKGLNTKQKEQLLGFWTDMITSQNYSRQNKEIKGDFVTAFGLASECYDKESKDLFNTTFADRILILHKELTAQEKREIIRHIKYLRENNIKPPKIELKIEQEANIEIDMTEIDEDETISEEIEDMAMNLDEAHLMSFTRATETISTIIMSNAHLNNRTKALKSDLIIAKMCMFLMKKGRQLTKTKIQRYEELKERFPEKTDVEIGKALNLSIDSIKSHNKRKKQKCQ